MIHRINSVAPDLDDRVIKPNQARDAKNLRFGASTDDSNLSGGVMVNGNVIVPNLLPQTGTNKVVGVYADWELQTTYFCLYNSDGAHGIYQIKTVGNNDIIQAVLGGVVETGRWLNFTEEMSVSMTSIDGKLYWTDNVNQPRMVNIAKGIRTQSYYNNIPIFGDVYPTVPKEWHYTQIKRAPQEPLELTVNSLSPVFSVSDPSVDFEDIFKSDDAWQFSYYYVYDNDEESRIAPATPLNWYSVNVLIRIPDREFLTYVKEISLIKKIVFIYRKNNDGEWSVVSTKINDSNFNGSQFIKDIFLLAFNPISSNITSNNFDAVPRISATNEIAQNRINHGAYLIDYPNWDGLNLNLVVVKNSVENTTTTTTVQKTRFVPPRVSNNPRGERTVIPGYFETYTETITVTSEFLKNNNRTFYRGFYNVGIELLDEWGRRIAVVNQQVIEIPNYVYQVTGLQSDRTSPFFAPFAFFEDKDNCYHIEYEVTGQFPSWCKYWRVVYSKNQSVNYFNKSIVKLYYWYSTGDVDYLSVINAGNVGSNDVSYTLKGIAIEISSGEPFLFTSDEEQYVGIAQEYPRILPDQTLTFEQQTPQLKEYKIKKQVGNFLYIEMDQSKVDLYPGWERRDGGNVNTEKDYFPLYYAVYLYSKKITPEIFYYQSTVNKSITDSLSGEIYGDCYLNKFKKQNQGTSQQVLNFTYQGSAWKVEGLTPVQTNTVDIQGYGISMNIRDIYSQLWISDIGQINIVNENQREVYVKNGICFSDPLIAGTQINGLSKFDPLDVRQAPLENGAITALAVTNATQREPGVMLAIGTYGVSSFYYDSIQLTNVDGTTNIAVSDRYLASQRPLQGQFGCSQLSSVTKTPLAAVYWWSDIINDFIRYSNAGLERLGLTYMFGNKLRNEVAGREVCTVYDYVTDEVILIPKGRNSFVFSERYKTFQGMREYINSVNETPERAISVGQRMYHFLNGDAWVTTPFTEKSIFFTSIKNPELTIVTNESPSIVKQWNQIKVYGPKPAYATLVTGDAEGFRRESVIMPAWWIARKGEFDAAIRRDISGGGNAMAGKVMESRILYSTFVFNPASFEKLNFIEIKSNMSVVQ